MPPLVCRDDQEARVKVVANVFRDRGSDLYSVQVETCTGCHEVDQFVLQFNKVGITLSSGSTTVGSKSVGVMAVHFDGGSSAYFQLSPSCMGSRHKPPHDEPYHRRDESPR